MANRGTKSVLQDMGWDEGFSMPVANDENKSLESEVQRKQQAIIQHQNDLANTDDRIHAMIQHLKNVRQELVHTQSLASAKKAEVETETHLLKISEREEGRLNQEVSKLKKNHEELKEKRNVHENNIFKENQKLDEMKDQMNWDQQALEAWLEESSRKDEDAMTLMKYTRQDEQKIKELSLKMEKLTDQVQQKKKTLDHETTNTLTAQIEVDKMAEDFRKAHIDRQDLIGQWESAIEQMQRRDKEMDLLASQLAEVKGDARQREDLINEKQMFLETEIDNNTEQEKKITFLERNAGRTRIEHQKAETARVQFQDELETLKRTVDRTATELEITRSGVSGLKKEVVEKNNKLHDAKDLHEALIEKLKLSTETSLSAEERASRFQEMLQEEEVVQKEIDFDVKNLRDTRFKKTQELHDVKVQERSVEAEIQGSQAASRNLNSKIAKLDHDSLKQQEIIYNQDFAIQQLERRISRMQGERSNDEKLHLEARIKVLINELEFKNTTHTLIAGQLKRLQDDIRRVTRELESNHGEKSNLTSKIQELNLYNDNSERELKKIIRSKQDMMVDENILKLDIKRLRGLLHSKADDVQTMEERRLQLQTAMQERRHEITIHQEMLTAQLRGADDERQKISSELHERISKIDKLRKRYEILMVSMAPPDEEGEKSQAHYVIKAAQEKEELQREGDELDAKIRKAEKEIRALENTLRMMNCKNESYRKSFNKVGETSSEMEEKQQLEEQMRAVMDKYKYKRRQIRELQEDLQTMSNTLDNLQRDEDAYRGIFDEKQNKALQLNKETDEQKGKLDRVLKQNTKYAKDLRNVQKARGETPEEKDFELRELREFNKNTMKSIGEVSYQQPEIMDSVNMYFSQASLPPPTPGPGRHSVASSMRSSISGMSSARSSLSSRGSATPGGNVTPLRVGTPVQIGSDADFGGKTSQASARSGMSGHGVKSSRSTSRSSKR